VVSTIPAFGGVFLAALPEPGHYLSLPKFAVHVALLLPFFWACIWVSKDAQYVRTNGLVWSSVVLAGGLVGTILWWLIPLYVIGLLAYLIAAGGSLIAYVYHRNSLVGPAAKVLTVQHIKNLLKGAGGDRKQIPQLVRLLNWDDRPVPIPTDDPEELEKYRLSQELLYDALWRRASEVEVLTSGTNAKVAYRIDGVLTARPALEREDAERLIEFVKKIAGLNVEDRRRPQQGKFTATVTDPVTGEDKTQEIEVRTAGSTSGERLTLRMLTQEKQFRVEDLGFTEQQLKVFLEILDKPSGLLICAGPPGSGLTTTLYAILRHHDAFTRNIHTLETQPKLDLEVITQHIYDPAKGVSFGRTLQSVLHMDPDILMVSDCPDAETARQVARGVANGKKIYLGMRAGSTFEALERWIKFVGDGKVAANGLLALTAQRLVRKLCPVCKVPYRPDPQLLRKANIPPERAKQFYRPRTEPRVDKHGNPIVCPNCQGSGYFGRMAVFELLVITPEVANLIRKGASINEIKAACRKRGMLYLQEEALQRVIEGVTSIQEVIRATRSGSGQQASVR